MKNIWTIWTLHVFLMWAWLCVMQVWCEEDTFGGSNLSVIICGTMQTMIFIYILTRLKNCEQMGCHHLWLFSILLTHLTKLLWKNPAETCHCKRKLCSSSITILWLWQFARKPLFRSMCNYFQGLSCSFKAFPSTMVTLLNLAALGCLKLTAQTLVFLRKSH